MSSSARTNSRPTVVRFVVTAMLAILTLGFGWIPAAHADGDVSWAVRTASSAFGSNRQNYSYSLNPGGTLTDAIVIVNHSAAPLTLAVYAADGFTTTAGQLDLGKVGEKQTGVGAWVRPSQSSVTVQANSSAEVPFTLDLPGSATPGDHLGGIVTSLTQPDPARGINVDRRLAIRIALRVGGELTPRLAIEGLHVTYGGTLNPFGSGSAMVSYGIHNTGNAIVTAEQAVSVSGLFGAFHADAKAIANSPPVLPGETWQMHVRVSGVAPGLVLTAQVTLTPIVTDASGTIAPAAAVRATAHTAAIPWTLLAMVAVILAGAAAMVILNRRRSRAATRREDARVHAAVEQALQESSASR